MVPGLLGHQLVNGLLADVDDLDAKGHGQVGKVGAGGGSGVQEGVNIAVLEGGAQVGQGQVYHAAQIIGGHIVGPQNIVQVTGHHAGSDTEFGAGQVGNAVDIGLRRSDNVDRRAGAGVGGHVHDRSAGRPSNSPSAL